VMEAESGEAAMEVARQQQPSIIICDTAVSGMSGFELYRQLTTQDPDTAPRFLFISGDKAATNGDSELTGVPVLAKPFTASDLETALVAAGIAAPRG